MYRGDVGMIQRRQNSGFAFESCGAVLIVGKGFRQEFDRDTAPQFTVGGLIHLAHAACPQVAGDFVMCQPGSNHEVWYDGSSF